MAQISSSEANVAAPSVNDDMARRAELHEAAIVVRQTVPVLVRLLMLPLLLAAATLLWLFVSVTGDLWHGETESDVLVGQVFGLVGALVLGIPGVIGLLVARFVRIDLERGFVEEIQDFRLFSIRHRTNMDEFKAVTVSSEQDAPTKSRRVLTLYNVNLGRSHKAAAIEITSFLSHDEAMGFAKALAMRLGLPCRDISRVKSSRRPGARHSNPTSS